MILDEKKFKNYHCNQWKSEDNENGIETMSLAELKEAVMNMERNATINDKDLSKVPVFIGDGNKMWCIKDYSYGCGDTGLICKINTRFDGKYSSELYYVAPDSRPEEGEYWNSRGISTHDVAGLVVSKLAGERLLRMVKLILENDSPESWLDYRESEPNWIQFKFRDSEFDLMKLEEMAVNNDNIITLDILKNAKIKL